MTDPAVNVRAAFREVTLGLMEWVDPPAHGPTDGSTPRSSFWDAEPVTYRPWCAQDDVEPYDLDASDEEGWAL